MTAAGSTGAPLRVVVPLPAGGHPARAREVDIAAVMAAADVLGHRVEEPPSTDPEGLLDDLCADPPDVVVLSEGDLAARAAGRPELDGCRWVTSSALGDHDAVLACAPGALGAAATRAEGATYVLCADEGVRGLVDRAGPDVARRTVVVPPGERLDALLTSLVARTVPVAPASLAGRDRPLRVVVAGHDLGFFAAVLEHLQTLPGVEVRVDHVPSFERHDVEASTALVQWADTVFCEWLSPVAAWYSHHKRAGQRLVVRLHRMELYNDWTERVDIDAIDTVVCVSPHYVRLTLERTGWPASKVACIPNYVDTRAFDRPKLAGAEHRLGFVGIVPSRKRLDIAFDVLERLRTADDRYLLLVKTKMPWDYPWNWRVESERTQTAALLRRVATTPSLRDGVVFDGHGSDVAAWMRRVGHVLSTSDDESFHLAPAEGMASGAVPWVRDWPGAETIYDRRWVRRSADEMATGIADLVASGGWGEAAEQARAQARASYDVDQVCRRFVDLLAGGALSPVPATLAVPVDEARGAAD